MANSSAESLGATTLTGFLRNDQFAVRLCTENKNGYPLLTDVRLNNAGETLYSWRAHENNESTYQPPVDVMIAIQSTLRAVLQKHSTSEGFDKRGLGQEIGYNMSMGG